MPRIHLCTLIALVSLATVRTLSAAELLPPDRAIGEVIDHYVDRRLAEAQVTAAPPADDSALARRLYLDLSGRIPTAAEARAYAQSTDPDKRTKLIAALVESPGFARHQATEFDELLRGDNPDSASLRPYLLVAFRERRPWDRMFRELLGVSSEPTRPEEFVLKRLKDTDALARDVSSTFFGLNISCAQCHNHPDIESLTQDYFYGMKAFFSRSYDFEGILLEREFADPVQFKSKSGELRTAAPMFLNGTKVELPPREDLARLIQEESKQIEALRKEFKTSKKQPPEQPVNLRGRLADLALAEENQERFARSIVNRLWYRLYGQGLVMLADQMHDANKPSHPELLDWLSRDLISHRFDLAHLIGGMVSSKAYARTSRWEGKESPAPAMFGVASIRPLSPMQWGLSHRLASRPDRLKDGISDKVLDTLEGEARKSFGQLIERPRQDHRISIAESMCLSNDESLLKLTGDELVPLLLKLPERDQQIEEVFWTVLSRAPTSDERRCFLSYAEKHNARASEALQDIVWALFNSAEFRFCY